MVIQPATMVNNGEFYGFLIGIETDRYRNPCFFLGTLSPTFWKFTMQTWWEIVT